MSDTRLDLLPCPFCGGDALYEQDHSYGLRSLRWSAGCRVETCMSYMGPTFARRKEAAVAWNRRAEHPAQAAAEVTDAMVEAACRAYDESADTCDEYGDVHCNDAHMRAALKGAGR